MNFATLTQASEPLLCLFHVQVYPDAIAQCVYSTFIHAFPASWNSFDNDFKTELCRIVSLWQVGKQAATYTR